MQLVHPIILVSSDIFRALIFSFLVSLCCAWGCCFFVTHTFIPLSLIFFFCKDDMSGLNYSLPGLPEKMENGKEESQQNLWNETQNPPAGMPKFLTCSVSELSSYCIDALRNMLNKDTKVIVIFSSEEHKAATYKLMWKLVNGPPKKVEIIRANPQEIVLSGLGCVNMHRTPLSKTNIETMDRPSIYLIQVDALKSDSVQAISTDLVPGSSFIFFHLTDGRVHQGSLPPAISKATRTAELISTILKILLGVLVSLYLLLVSVRLIMR